LGESAVVKTPTARGRVSILGLPRVLVGEGGEGNKMINPVRRGVLVWINHNLGQEGRARDVQRGTSSMDQIREKFRG